MANPVTRAQFLRGDFGGRKHAIRPPWAQEEEKFVDVCTRCGDCITACPEKILEKGRGGYPQVNFFRGECTFCGACVSRCSGGALLPGAPGAAPWGLKAKIGEACLAKQQVVCRSCGELCPEGAIRFFMAPGGVAKPRVAPDGCNGCGACVKPCPVAAVEIAGVRVEAVA
jgi:ferredoxin-type protein NapF